MSDDELRDNLLEEKKIQAILEAREEIMDNLLSKCRFSLDKEEVAAYSQNIVHNYESQAMLYDMELEQYREDILGYTKKEFYEVCYEEGEEEIKTYLVIGAIAWKEFPEKASDWETQDIYSVYQQLENAVYSYFIQTDKDF